MPETDPFPGQVNIAPQVLVTIVRQATLRNEGVQALAAKTPRRSRIKGRRGTDAGIEVVLAEEGVHAVIHIIARPNANIMRLAESLQAEIARAIEHMVELPAARVSVFVDDVSTAAAA